MEPGIYKIIGIKNDSSPGGPGYNIQMEKLEGKIFTLGMDIKGLPRAKLIEEGRDSPRTMVNVLGYYRRLTRIKQIASVT